MTSVMSLELEMSRELDGLLLDDGVGSSELDGLLFDETGINGIDAVETELGIDGVETEVDEFSFLFSLLDALFSLLDDGVGSVVIVLGIDGVKTKVGGGAAKADEFSLLDDALFSLLDNALFSMAS